MIATPRARWAVGLIVAVALVATPIGGWLRFGPVNYFGCGVTPPERITAADLVGTYVAADGARLRLLSDGILQAEGLKPDNEVDSRPPLSGSGTWQLISAERSTVAMAFTSDTGYVAQPLGIAGTREEPQLYRLLGDPDSCDFSTLTRVAGSS